MFLLKMAAGLPTGRVHVQLPHAPHLQIPPTRAGTVGGTVRAAVPHPSAAAGSAHAPVGPSNQSKYQDAMVAEAIRNQGVQDRGRAELAARTRPASSRLLPLQGRQQVTVTDPQSALGRHLSRQSAPLSPDARAVHVDQLAARHGDHFSDDDLGDQAAHYFTTPRREVALPPGAAISPAQLHELDQRRMLQNPHAPLEVQARPVAPLDVADFQNPLRTGRYAPGGAEHQIAQHISNARQMAAAIPRPIAPKLGAWLKLAGMRAALDRYGAAGLALPFPGRTP